MWTIRISIISYEIYLKICISFQDISVAVKSTSYLKRRRLSKFFEANAETETKFANRKRGFLIGFISKNYTLPQQGKYKIH